MDLSTVLMYVAAAFVAAGIGVLVFALFPSRKPSLEPSTGEGQATTVGPVQQSSIGASLVAVAPRGYVGWLERQIVLAGRPIGWTVTKIMVWKLLLPVIGATGRSSRKSALA